MSGNPAFQFPPLFAERMKIRLGNAFADFSASMQEEPPVAVRMNPSKNEGTMPKEKVPWCNMGYYLPQRPLFTADPLFHGGAYYVQEPSSMFLEQAFRSVQLPEKAVVLDLCAAPGGKTTHLLSLLKPDDLLVSNEVIRSRVSVLQENVQKWGYPNVLVTQNDPTDFGKLPEIFDLVVVDSPCSGEGLFRKDRAYMSEWSPANASLCVARQKRIVAEAWKCLKQGGFLIYSTCTFNPAENEENIRWLTEQFDAESIDIRIDDNWNIVKVFSGDVTGYQFFPHLAKGEGFFISVARKKDLVPTNKLGKVISKPGKTDRVKIPDEIRNWISPGYEGSFLLKDGVYYTVPFSLESTISYLGKYLRIIQPGIPLTTGYESKLIPHHAMVQSQVFNRQVWPEWELDLTGAVRFLQKVPVPPRSSEKGPVVVSYRGVLLGWLKNLGNRTNNYFPGERRIRMTVDPVPQPWHEMQE